MGSGVAKEVRAHYPGAFETYRAEYEKSGLQVGKVVWFIASPEPKLAIANAITQQFYGRDGRQYVDYAGLERCFMEVARVARLHGLPVHYPRVGAQLGGGDWQVIQPLIERALDGIEHHLWTLPAPRPARPR